MPEFLISPERQQLISELVEKLPKLRKRRRISQEDLGIMVGKSRQKISDIERKTAPMGWDTYIAVCTALETCGVFEDADEWYYTSREKWFTQR